MNNPAAKAGTARFIIMNSFFCAKMEIIIANIENDKMNVPAIFAFILLEKMKDLNNFLVFILWAYSLTD